MRNRPSKSHLICYVLMRHGPMTRHEILRRVYDIDHGRTKEFKRTSNNSYFKKTLGTWRSDNGGTTSVVMRGLVSDTGVRDKKGIYLALTKKGEKLAKECDDWFCRLYRVSLKFLRHNDHDFVKAVDAMHVVTTLSIGGFRCCGTSSRRS